MRTQLQIAAGTVMSLQSDQGFLKGSRLLQGAFQLDHSTSIGDLGSLFVWHGDKPVQQLKRQLADAYGAVWSFPSTHGTTILNILALLTACPAGGRVLINRDAHSSVTAAMIQGGLHPVYLVPEYRCRARPIVSDRRSPVFARR